VLPGERRVRRPHRPVHSGDGSPGDLLQRGSSPLAARGKTAENKVEQTKAFVLYFLETHELTKMEGKQFTLRRQKNSQDSVRLLDPTLIPLRLQRVEARFDGERWERIIASVPEETRALLVGSVQETTPVNDAIKQAVARKEEVAGATVTRGYHVRVA
jgi:hypothetical protein